MCNVKWTLTLGFNLLIWCLKALQLKRGESQSETEVLMSALGAIQDKNSHLESSLSAETRLKLDLFSALGEAKRQIEIQQGNW
jgi:Macoilin family